LPEANLYNWFGYALTEQVDLMNERYYFDIRDNQFFSIFITDWFLIKDPGDGIESPYTTSEFLLLEDRIGRIEKKDETIIPVPRLSIKSRQELMRRFLRTTANEDSAVCNKLVEEENGKTKFNFNNSLPPDLQEKWEAWKNEEIKKQADIFCNLHHIDLSTSSLWTDRKATTMSLGRNEDIVNEKVITKQKSWWKFWK
jgi:hypothetical protein